LDRKRCGNQFRRRAADDTVAIVLPSDESVGNQRTVFNGVLPSSHKTLCGPPRPALPAVRRAPVLAKTTRPAVGGPGPSKYGIGPGRNRHDLGFQPGYRVGRANRRVRPGQQRRPVRREGEDGIVVVAQATRPAAVAVPQPQAAAVAQRRQRPPVGREPHALQTGRRLLEGRSFIGPRRAEPRERPVMPSRLTRPLTRLGSPRKISRRHLEQNGRRRAGLSQFDRSHARRTSGRLTPNSTMTPAHPVTRKCSPRSRKRRELRAAGIALEAGGVAPGAHRRDLPQLAVAVPGPVRTLYAAAREGRWPARPAPRPACFFRKLLRSEGREGGPGRRPGLARPPAQAAAPVGEGRRTPCPARTPPSSPNSGASAMNELDQMLERFAARERDEAGESPPQGPAEPEWTLPRSRSPTATVSHSRRRRSTAKAAKLSGPATRGR